MRGLFSCPWMLFCVACVALGGSALFQSLHMGAPSLLRVSSVKEESLERV